MIGLIIVILLFGSLLIQIGRTRFTYDYTDRILRNELKRRSSIRNKHKLMHIKGVTIK